MRPSLGAPRKKWMENRWRRRRGEGTGETGEEREEYKPIMVRKKHLAGVWNIEKKGTP